MKRPKYYIVVDDDKTNNLICEFTIKSFNPQAVIMLFLEPEEALMFIKEDYSGGAVDFPTILFLDVNMPGMSGWEFLDVFQKFEEHIKNQFQIFILTSSIEDFSNEAKLYPFVSGFLSKPLKKDKLKGLVEALAEVSTTKSPLY
ncbi:response regulator [Salinimicrobium sp. TH3]|uniref:response regulator n=1 Tax=Salinimicrobium sp. TH3 TaxID=2997342 RepID=UPI002275F098|nr:response regulator [Salinimicrobium sp. TH3]MCY2687740.1 response regulator [Salinimicrobium sp. TH3]